MTIQLDNTTPDKFSDKFVRTFKSVEKNLTSQCTLNDCRLPNISSKREWLSGVIRVRETHRTTLVYVRFCTPHPRCQHAISPPRKGVEVLSEQDLFVW